MNLTATERVKRVTTNGAVSLVLFSPVKIPGAIIYIVNDTTQAGATTITTAAGNIQGSSSLVLTGPGASAILLADGANYKILSQNSASGTGAVTSVVAGSGLTGGGTGAVTVDVVAADGTITVNADSIQVGTVPVAQVSGAALSARTLTGTAPITVDGDNAAHDLSASRTIAITGATGSVNGSIRLTTDLGGSSTAPVVVQLTGATGVVGLVAASLVWASGTAGVLKGADVTTNGGTAPSLTIQAPNETGTTSVGGKLVLGSGSGTSTQGAIGIKLGATEVLTLARVNVSTIQTTVDSGDSLSWTLGSERFWQIISDTEYIDCDSLNVRTTGGTSKGFWNNTGLRIGDGSAATHALEVAGSEVFLEGAFVTFKGTVTSPSISHLAPAAGNGSIFGITAAPGAGVAGSGSDTAGGDVQITGGGGKGVNGNAGGALLRSGLNAAGTERASVYAHMNQSGYAAVSLFGTAGDSDLNHRSNVLWINNVSNIGTNARPATGTQWYSLSGVPTIFGSNANSKEVQFDNTLGGTINLTALTSTQSLVVHVDGVSYRIPLI